MPYSGYLFDLPDTVRRPKIGRPDRGNRAKVKAGRRAARRR